MKIRKHSDSTRSVLSANLMAQSEDSRALMLERNSADQPTRSVSALLKCLCAFFLIIGIHVTSVAQEVVIFGASHIGPEGDSRLHRIDPVTGAARPVGLGIGFQRVSGMDFDPATGILYATGEREAGLLDVNVLLTIDPRSGVGTEIGPTGVVDFLGLFSGDPNFEGVFSDLSFRPSDNTLFGFSFPGQWVATINLATGEATQLAFETVNGDRGIEANAGNGLAFLDSVLVHAGSTSPLDTEQPPSCAPNCVSALHHIDLGTNLVTTSVALDFPFVAGFDNDFVTPRANGMDHDVASDTLYASIIYGFRGNGATFLGTIDPTSGAVALIGETEFGMDALAVISSADINSNTINFSGQLDIVQVDNGTAVYSGVPIGTVFSGAFDDVIVNGFISDGTTVTSVSCCIFADGFDVVNDDILDAETATLINSLAGTSFVAGDLIDIIGFEADAPTSGGGRIEVGIDFVLDPLAFDDFSFSNYPPNPDDVLISVFFIAEGDDLGEEIYSAIGAIDSDGDGIEDAIDGTFNGVFNDQSTVRSNDFTDQHLGGSTFGSIVTRSDNLMMVADDQALGVSLTAVGGTGTTQVQACNIGSGRPRPATISLTDGDQIIVTCGSFTGETLAGPVTVSIGMNVDVSIPAGAIALIEELPGTVLSVSNVGEPGAPDIVINDNGNITSLGADEPPLMTILTVVVNGCDSGVANDVLRSGSSIAELVTDAFNSGGEDAVEDLVEDLEDDGILNDDEAEAIEDCAEDDDDDSDSDSDSDSD